MYSLQGMGTKFIIGHSCYRPDIIGEDLAKSRKIADKVPASS